MDDKELDEMAKDVESTKIDVQPTETQSGFVEDKETYVKPDGETTSSPERTPNVIKEESGMKKWMIGGLATILIVGLGAASAWLYTDAQSVRNELQSMKTGLDTAKADAAKLRDEVQSLKAKTIEPVVSSDDIDSRAKVMATALEAATIVTDDKATIHKTKGDFTVIYTSVPKGDGPLHIFKNTKGALVEVALLDIVLGDSLKKSQADDLKSQYGFDAAAFDIKVED